MNSKFLKSPFFVVGLSLSSLSIAPLQGVTHKVPIHDSAEHERLEICIRNLFTKFEEAIDLFKTQLSGISPKSTEKLVVVCKKLKLTIDQVESMFIEPIRTEANQLKGTSLENSNYNKLLHTLLSVCDELKHHFDRLYTALHKSLQGNATAISVAKNIKPIIDTIISDSNFKSIDARLAEAYTYALSYDIIIEIKPQYRKIIDIEDDNSSKTYHLKLAQAFAVMREGLEDLRKECRKPSAVSQAEMLRIIRSRL